MRRRASNPIILPALLLGIILAAIGRSRTSPNAKVSSQTSLGGGDSVPENSQPITEALDLSDADSELPKTAPPPIEKPYDPERDRNKYRGWIALFLLSILAAIVLITFFLFWYLPDRDKDLKDLVSILLSPIVALVGSATGYYFGAQSKSSL